MIHSFEDLYRLFAETIKNCCPDGLLRCKEIQTFVVVDSFQDISNEQLTKTLTDKNKPYFYSKKWEREGYPPNNISFEYPLLAIFPIGTTLNNPISGCEKKYNFDIGVFDILDESCQTSKCGDVCKDRDKFEIYRDSLELLRLFIIRLSEMKIYNKNDGSFKYGFDLPSLNFTLNQKESSILKNSIVRDTKVLKTEMWHGGQNNLYGTIINELTLSL